MKNYMSQPVQLTDEQAEKIFRAVKAAYILEDIESSLCALFPEKSFDADTIGAVYEEFVVALENDNERPEIYTSILHDAIYAVVKDEEEE